MSNKKVSYDKLGKGLSSVGTYIGNNKKPLLYVGGAIAIVIVGYAIVRRIKGGIEGDKVVGGKFIDQQIDLSKTSINTQTAKNYAESLFEAFNYTWGTDKSIIDSVFSKINSEDFKMIYNAFGKRSYSTLNGGSPSEKWYAPDTWIGSVKVDLIQWINNELGFGDGALKDKIRKVVEPAGFVMEK
jgi:hypothetical protein